MTRAGTQAMQHRLMACALSGHFLSWRPQRSETPLGARTGKSVFRRKIAMKHGRRRMPQRTCYPLIVIERENKTAKRISA